MHHLDGAAGEPERHGPEGALPRPVGDLVECRERVLHGADLGLLRGEGIFAADAACDREAAGIGGNRGSDFGGGFSRGGGDAGTGGSADEGCGEGRGCCGVVNGGFLSWRWGMKLPRSALGAAERRANMVEEEELN